MGTSFHLARAVGNLCVLQVHVAVGHSKVRLYVDCRKVAERPIGEAGSPPATGFITLGRLAKAPGPWGSSAVVSLGFVLPGYLGASRSRSPCPSCLEPHLANRAPGPIVAPAPDAVGCVQ